MPKRTRKPAPPGYKWVFRRYRRVRGSKKVLDAFEYGLKAWPMLVKV